MMTIIKRAAIYLPFLLFYISVGGFGFWLYTQSLCCGVPVLWAYLVMLFGACGLGGAGVVYWLRKYRRGPWQRRQAQQR